MIVPKICLVVAAIALVAMIVVDDKGKIMDICMKVVVASLALAMISGLVQIL